MGHMLQKITGAVFFVDILGFGALTQNKIELDDTDFTDWNIPSHLQKDNQSLAATILVEFRSILHKLEQAFPDVTIAQLSDCAFIWSANIRDVIIVAHKIMWDALNAGILCRAGLSCGEIIETPQNNQLGRLIVGEAVSNAVKLEGVAKGARIMIDTDVYGYLFEYDEVFCNKMSILFKPVINPLDFKDYDEFKWYYVPELDKNMIALSEADQTYKLNATKSRLKLAVKLRFHPRFSWNSKGKDGRAQICPSVAFVSANEQTIFNISHWFEWNNIADKRSIKNTYNLKQRIDTDFAHPKIKKGVITFDAPE